MNQNPNSRNASTRKLRVGIWCAYHITLEQSEGIGVFAHNIARGLSALGPKVTVTMTAKPGDEHLMAETVAAGNGRIQVRSPRPRGRLRELGGSVIRELRRGASKLAVAANRRVDRYSLPLASKKGKLIRKLKRFVWKKLLKTSCAVSERCAQMNQSASCHQEKQWQQIIDQCDVWLLPYVGLDRSFSKPTVVTVHDLVCYHFPEVLSPEALVIFKSLAETVSSDASIVACMSNFIAKNDLVGVLNLPQEKIRIVEPAAPTDFGKLGDLTQACKDYPVLQEQFLFYPSAFRSYKNHELLIEALGKLRESGNEHLRVVFTGIHAARPEVLALMRKFKVEDRVHILGKVPRDVLSLLYKQALATIVPSRYEQGSFPLMEALHWGCPIACSRIPSLTELLSKMGDSMLYFDPDSVDELVGVIRNIMDNKTELLAQQQSKREEILGRTWSEAAVDWRDVFETAIDRHQRSSTKSIDEQTERAA